jgi:sugar phosphate isomerase/epimerase
MFQYGITAALEELPATQPVTLRGPIEELCKTAKKIGYDALELHVREPKRYNVDEIRKTLDAYGLTVCAVANGMEYTVGGLSLIDDDKAKREAALARILEHADFAAALKARLIVGIMRGNIPRNGDANEYRGRFSAALGKICDYAEKKHIDVVLESIMRYINNYLCGVPETMDFISAQNRKNLSLHIDTHSMAIEERNLKESIRYCLNKPLGYVHYSDNNRRYPGGGALDFGGITHAILEIGYRGFITVECLPWPSAEESAQRAFTYMKSIEKMALIENDSQGVSL